VIQAALAQSCRGERLDTKKAPAMQELARDCNLVQNPRVGPTGVEVPPRAYGKTAFSGIGGTETGTLAAQLALADADLRMVIDAWETLARGYEGPIMGMARAAR
jgi:hypothetical protein